MCLTEDNEDNEVALPPIPIDKDVFGVKNRVKNYCLPHFREGYIKNI